MANSSAKKFFSTSLLFLTVILLSCDAQKTTDPAPEAPRPDSLSKETVNAITRFLRDHPAMNQQTVFLINMRLPANQYRFFVYDLAKQQITARGLVAQGINTRPDTRGRLRFSNEPGSNCSSLGKYRIGQKYKGKFGTAYKLHGLDKTNSNAYARAIVLHKYDDMPNNPADGDVYYSLGCPMVSPKFFTHLTGIIDAADKPIILQIVY